MTIRNELARAAIYGSNNLLMDYFYDVDGYVWDGIQWQGNGMSLARAIEIMESLTDEQMAELEAVGIIPALVTITINKTDYTIIDSKTADQCEADGLLNIARQMRASKIARELTLTRPNGKKMFQTVQYESGAFGRVSFFGWM